MRIVDCHDCSWEHHLHSASLLWFSCGNWRVFPAVGGVAVILPQMAAISENLLLHCE